MATCTIRRADREQLEQQERRHEELMARLAVEERRRVAEQRLAQIAAMFEE
jgi:hypothetical protein